MRGEAAPVGAERTAKNGYVYVKTPDNKWRLKHHIIAEKELGRSINTASERVFFKDKDRKNFNPKNIVVEDKIQKSKAARRAVLESRIAELKGQLAELDSEEDEEACAS